MEWLGFGNRVGKVKEIHPGSSGIAGGRTLSCRILGVGLGTLEARRGPQTEVSYHQISTQQWR